MLITYNFFFKYCYIYRYKHYERWATASEFPIENIVNDGTTTYENRLVTLNLVFSTYAMSD